MDTLGRVNSWPDLRISLTALIAVSRGGVLKYDLIILFIYFILWVFTRKFHSPLYCSVMVEIFVSWEVSQNFYFVKRSSILFPKFIIMISVEHEIFTLWFLLVYKRVPISTLANVELTKARIRKSRSLLLFCYELWCHQTLEFIIVFFNYNHSSHHQNKSFIKRLPTSTTSSTSSTMNFQQ